MRKDLLALLIGGSLAVTSVQADTVLGLYASVDAWSMESSGSFGNSEASMQEFTLGDENKVSFAISLEHPIPVIPNLRIRTNDLSTSGSTSLDASFTFNDVTFDESTTVATTFDIQNTDITLYYEVFDNDLITFDFGLTGKYLDGDIKVANQETNLDARQSFKGIVPMLYGSLQIGVPATGISFFGEMNALTIDENKIQDYQAGVAYTFVDNLAIDLMVRAGYREFSLELDNLDDVFTDWSFNGPFLGVQAHF